HYLDDLSAKVNIFRKAFASESKEQGEWSSFNKALGRYLYRGIYDRPIATTEELINVTNTNNNISETTETVQEKLL
ncbi:MAG: hypothetical protein PH343_02190, partial [Nitrospira sp.]|nr:hypothetical protein [Nitrospira sp.]